MDRKVVVVTGSNTGVGYGIIETLLQSHITEKTSPLTLVMACRDLRKAQLAKETLIKKFFSANPTEGDETIQIVKCDLADMQSVFQAAADIKARFSRIDSLVFNAGYIPVKSISIYKGVIAFITAPSDLAKSTGDVLIQEEKVLTRDGQYGLAFAANTLGHFILLRELESLLEDSARLVRENGGDGVKIIWMTSVTVEEKFFELNDIQGVKSDHPYESSKYVMELVHKALGPRLREKGIYTFLASPGIVATNITQGKVPVFLVAWLLVLLRFLFISGINITPQTAATSTAYLVTNESAGSLDPDKVYHSDVTPFGKRFVRYLGMGAKASDSVAWEVVEALEQIWRNEKNAKTRITL
ncbi:hypothetical protein BC829DRAFT_91649 [Chytridium lagenaria]|nr:hypothetical protein BC829DRAFT_91649 [Chytridium lagenaria]